jgi:SAM-dependent methyltransferase
MRRLRRRGHPSIVAQAQAQALPFAGGAFHAALSTFPTEYIFDPVALTEIRRTLAPGGELVVVISSRILPVFLWDRVSRWVYDVAGQAPRPDPSWLAPFEAAGFQLALGRSRPGASVFQAFWRVA